jgi:hypothetical protein
MCKTATTALWFSSFKIFKHFRQILAAGFEKKEINGKNPNRNFY